MNDFSLRFLLTLQFRVVAALVLRETRATFGASQIGYLWAIITPAISVGFLVFLFSQIGREAPFGTSLTLFFATGILPLQFFKKLSSTLMSAFSVNRALLSYPLIKEMDTLFARYILISVTFLLIMIIFFGVLIMAGLAEFPRYPYKLIQAFMATSLLGLGLGTINAVIASMFNSWKQIEGIVLGPLLFVSGIFYVPSYLPPAAVDLLKWNPVLHLVEWFREGFYSNYDSYVLEPLYPMSLAMVFILVGLLSERVTRKKRV